MVRPFRPRLDTGSRNSGTAWKGRRGSAFRFVRQMLTTPFFEHAPACGPPQFLIPDFSLCQFLQKRNIPLSQGGRHETDQLERQRPAGLPEKGLCRGLCNAGCRRLLRPGDQNAARSGGVCPRRLHRIHLLCREKRLLRHRGLDKAAAAFGQLRHRRGGAQPRGAGHHAGVPRLLPGQRLCAQRPGGPGPHRLPHALGGRPAPLPAGAGRQKAGGAVRRHERGPQRDRPEKPRPQPGIGRLLRRRARTDDPPSGQRASRTRSGAT